MSKTMAVLDTNNNVINIIVCDDSEQETSQLITYTDNNPAYMDGDYFEGYFYPPKPFLSWIRDNQGNWVAPIPLPGDGNAYDWDEENQQWLLLETTTPELSD
jgi:hypothetical protein